MGGGKLPLATRKWRTGGVGGDVAGCRELIENGRNEGIGVCVCVWVCVFAFVFVVFSCLEASTMLQSPDFLAIKAASFRSLFLAILAE